MFPQILELKFEKSGNLTMEKPHQLAAFYRDLTVDHAVLQGLNLRLQRPNNFTGRRYHSIIFGRSALELVKFFRADRCDRQA